MSSESLTDSDTPSNNGHRHGLDVEIPTIKILLYTDAPDEITPDDKRKTLGLAFMLEHLRAKEPAFAKLSIKWVSRNSSTTVHADQKLDKVFEDESSTGHPFDEIWFFGLHQGNKSNSSFGVFPGGPESELTEPEVTLLKTWMSNESVGGGVLLTGDHNHERPDDTIASTNAVCPGTAQERFLGRGRALGRCVPRAGQLRKWENEPTSHAENSHDTVANSGFQQDRTPQELILWNVDADGNHDPNGQPHPLFAYRPGRWIQVFPDHPHEGELIVDLGAVNPNVWPGQTRPQVVARGVDSRHATLIDLVATYNGDIEDVGRIVADSSWHHYFNLNVKPFAHPGPEGSAADQIGQFYANLAVWLSPRRARTRMVHAMLWDLATYTALMEPLGDIDTIGREANAILREKASPCESDELIQALVPARYGKLQFHEGSVLSHLPSRELLLGSILNRYHNEMIRAEKSDASYQPERIENLIESGFSDALKFQAAQLDQLASETLRLIELE